MRPDVVARHLRSHYSSTRAMRGGLRDEKGRPLRAGKRKAPAWDWGAWGWGFQLRGRTQHYTNATCHPDTGLSGLPRCSANRGWRTRLDIDCLGGLNGLRGLLDREMQYALVEMSGDGSVFWLEW
jgi:hypothetical protein